MLEIIIPEQEIWDDVKEEFVGVKETVLKLEHSLVSLSKWESKWHIPFLDSNMTFEQTIDYIKCMTLTQNVDPNVYNFLTNENIEKVSAYIQEPMTATWFSNSNNNRVGTGKKDIITAEVIYYWMITLQIPFECRKWHLNKLLTLIRVCNEKNAPKKKMSKNEIINKNRALNEARRAKYGTKG